MGLDTRLKQAERGLEALDQGRAAANTASGGPVKVLEGDFYGNDARLPAFYRVPVHECTSWYGTLPCSVCDEWQAAHPLPNGEASGPAAGAVV